MYKANFIKTGFDGFGVKKCEWPSQSPDLTPLNTKGINWKPDCESGLLIQHHQPDLPNGHKFPPAHFSLIPRFSVGFMAMVLKWNAYKSSMVDLVSIFKVIFKGFS